MREYYSKNKEKAKEYSKKYNEENKEFIKELSAKYRKNNPEKIRIHNRNSKSRKKNAPGKMSKDIVSRLMVLQKGKCTACNKKLNNDYHLDHIIPLALGGTNFDSNIQLLHSICNKRKQAKHPVDFMQSLGFLL